VAPSLRLRGGWASLADVKVAFLELCARSCVLGCSTLSTVAGADHPARFAPLPLYFKAPRLVLLLEDANLSNAASIGSPGDRIDGKAVVFLILVALAPGAMEGVSGSRAQQRGQEGRKTRASARVGRSPCRVVGRGLPDLARRTPRPVQSTAAELGRWTGGASPRSRKSPHTRGRLPTPPSK
jgi:hypothetical protein